MNNKNLIRYIEEYILEGGKAATLAQHLLAFEEAYEATGNGKECFDRFILRPLRGSI